MTVSVKLFATLRKYLPEDAVNKTVTLQLENNATTNDIIRSHGGNISLGKSPLNGLRVTISLPL